MSITERPQMSAKTPASGPHATAQRASRTGMSSTSTQIRDLIVARHLRPGDGLPTEIELCELLGVSRTSIREAIKTLATLDIVEVRHGHGTFVGHMSLDALVESLIFRGVLSPGGDLHALREVVEVRQALDLAMADRIVASLQGTRNETLHRLVEEMAHLQTRGETFPVQDRLFHAELLSRIDNSLVGQLVTAFWDVYSGVLPRLGLGLPADLELTVCAHGDMLNAAEDGDVERFRTAVVDHYRPLLRALDAPQVGAAG